MSEETKQDRCVNREVDPVGSRLLVTINLWNAGDQQLSEVFVEEWSPAGFVKLRFPASANEQDYGEWHRPMSVEIVEKLPAIPERPKGFHDVSKFYLDGGQEE